jgi:hypothetical protein
MVRLPLTVSVPVEHAGDLGILDLDLALEHAGMGDDQFLRSAAASALHGAFDDRFSARSRASAGG